MNRTFRMVWCLYILRWIFFSSRFPAKVEGVVQDQECIDNCNCCKNGKCHPGIRNWPNVCSDGCIDRHRGAKCYELCTYNNCLSCPDSMDVCTICFDGFHLGPKTDCTSECPTNCKACISNTMCTACKDGYYNKDGSKTCPYSYCPENCICNGKTCITCKNGFYDIAKECSKRCPSNCMSCSSRELCTDCKHGFYNGYEFDNDLRHLFNNCTIRCRGSCSVCLSYDNCLRCIRGRYGKKCQHDCAVGCKDQTCNIESGYCSCSSNFDGNKCMGCVSTKYGTYCNETCPEYCKNDKCNKTLGHCSEGCMTNTITGAICNVCTVGMHGIFCNKTCPTNCKGKICNRTTGFCSKGCEGNFKGLFCETCIQGKYGAACYQDCPVKCENSLCKKEIGNCFQCTGNFDGDKCNICKDGFYGLNCVSLCPSHCFNKSCDINSGKCNYGCKINYSGDKCCVHSNNCIDCSSDTECQKCKSGYYSKLCEKKCPVDCLDSCDISTGVCSDCIINHFGPFCNFKCSENCYASRSSATHNCASSDGTCMFGCKQGFFGLYCNETCSSLCIDTLCRQESGICMKGCTSSKDDQICLLSLGKPKDVSDSKSTTTTNIILATLLAVTSTAICILILKKLIKKIRSAIRQIKAAAIQSPFQNLQNEEVIAVTELDNIAYEIIGKKQGASEHTYDTASPSAPNRTVSYGDTEYMNLKI